MIHLLVVHFKLLEAALAAAGSRGLEGEQLALQLRDASIERRLSKTQLLHLASKVGYESLHVGELRL